MAQVCAFKSWSAREVPLAFFKCFVTSISIYYKGESRLCRSRVATAGWSLQRGAASSSWRFPSTNDFLHLSRTNIQKMCDLISHESQYDPLNASQCRSMSLTLVRTLENIEGLCRDYPLNRASAASKNLYRVSAKAKELVESCCSVDRSHWCQATIFQIQNEEAFKEIVLEASLCYNTIYELAKEINGYGELSSEDLRCCSTFEPPTADEVLQDRIALLKRLEDFVHDENIPGSLIRKQHLAQHLLKRLKSIHQQSPPEGFEACDLSMWPSGMGPDGEWGRECSIGSSVYKTTWLDVPCAKKVFSNTVQGRVALAEAKFLATLSHPNIVKFICYGHAPTVNSAMDPLGWTYFIAMELMETSLESFIKNHRGAPFTLLSAVDIMVQIAYGMLYFHEKGFANRDLKPGNVVVRRSPDPRLKNYLQVKLVDFGISCKTILESQLISYPNIGTTLYRAPEAFKPCRINWLKADVYSFAVTCSVILSGNIFPYPGSVEKLKGVEEAVKRGERPKLPEETPQDLKELIKECWDTNPRSRPGFVDICIRLEKLRHKLLREDYLDHSPKWHLNLFTRDVGQPNSKKRKLSRDPLAQSWERETYLALSNLYIEQMIKILQT